MSNPISFRYPFAVEGKAEPEIVEMLQFHDDKLVSLSNANKSLAAKVAALVPGTSSAATTSNVTNISEEIIVSGSNVGFVNDQTGVTSYQTQQSDSGSLLVLDDASPVAVTLAVLASMPGIQLPWWAAFVNLGAGTVTLTPATGTISYAGNIGAASLAITTGNFAFVYFDGTDFWAVIGVATSASVPNFADNESPSGSGLSWTLANSPSPSASLQLYSWITGFGAVLLVQGQDYTLAGNAITITAAYTIGSLYAFYRY